MRQEKQYPLSSLITASLLIGFLGFALGFNYPKLEQKLSSRNQKTQLPEDINYESVERLYDELRTNYAGTLEYDKLLDGLKKGLANAAGDPYTAYLDPEAAKEFQESLDGQFSGIGAEISIKNERLVIVAPLDGTPAKEAGLQASDHITKIDGQDTNNMGIDEAVSKIRGEAGSEVKLTIIRGDEVPREVVIKRAVIEIPSITAELKNGSIGYIELSRFGNDTADKLHQAAEDLKKRGASKFILDVRNNPGGLLNVAVDVASEFLPKGKLVVEERRDGTVLKSLKSAGGLLVGLTTIVLINEGSASASEIIAGALKDNGAAALVGKKTFGKGSVQEMVDLENGGVLKVTISRWYTPNGKNISEEGIEPDVSVELSQDDSAANRDPQLEKALEMLAR